MSHAHTSAQVTGLSDIPKMHLRFQTAAFMNIFNAEVGARSGEKAGGQH